MPKKPSKTVSKRVSKKVSKKPPARRPTKRAKPAGSMLLAGESAVRALTSPLRMEILQAFAGNPRLTVRDIAEKLGKPRGSLYYHVRKLAQIGVLAEVERYLVGRRYESVYEVVAERIAVGADTSTPAQRDATVKFVWATLRQIGREFEAAMSAGLIGSSDGPEVGRRQLAWLTEIDRAKIQELFGRIETICLKADASKKGQPYSITCLAVPLVERES